MALTLEQYAVHLESRRDLNWPAPPEPERPKAKPHLVKLPQIRVVSWNVYGTLLCLHGGEMFFEHPQKFIMDIALEKTIEEFKMWGSMSRKPGQPAEYMGHIYNTVLTEHRAFPGGGEKHPEVVSDRIWEAILKKLLQKDYKFDAGFYGSLNEYSRKIAYFFHASLQGIACYPGATTALTHVRDAGLENALLADGQCFTPTQLQRGLAKEGSSENLDDLIPPTSRFLSYEVKGKKPSERLFRHALSAWTDRGIKPDQILHIGSRIQQDLIPARRLGMKTGLFAGDRGSLQATPEQLKEPPSRPDILLTQLDQIADVVG